MSSPGREVGGQRTKLDDQAFVDAWLAAGFALATVALTWPLAAHLSDPVALRDDYLSNLWNFWWVPHALFELHTTPYFSEWLHHPLGVSLARHTLSPLNSLPGGLLSGVFGAHAAYGLLLLLHFWLSAWCCALLAREITGSWQAAVIAGVVYSFSPFHFYYVAQLNAATLEWLPLAMLCLFRCYRSGSLGWSLAVAASACGLALTSSYYLVYAAIFGALLLIAGRSAVPNVEWSTGARRISWAGGLAAAGVAVVAWPLLADLLVGVGTGGSAEAAALQRQGLGARSLDLYGFPWVGPPERVLLSWPSMLGYAAMALVLASIKAVARQRFWCGVGVVFLILGMGPSLMVNGADTGVPLPGAWLSELPLLGMLRKADRSFVMLQLIFALLCAIAWSDVARRFADSSRPRTFLFACVLGVIALESSAVPIRTTPLRCSPIYDRIAGDPGIEALVELPVHPATHGSNARYGFCQRVHGKRLAQGYVTSLALTPAHHRQAQQWMKATRELGLGNAALLVAMLARSDVDAVVLHKQTDAPRAALASRELKFTPFVVDSARLLGMRQLGARERRDVPRALLARRRKALETALGSPAWEDGTAAVFRAPAAP